jgi:hypothetical protein
MAKARVYAKLDKAGIADLMKSEDLGKVLEQVAKKLASSAGGGYEVEVNYDRRSSRVIAMVKSDNFGREVSTGALARAAGMQQS